MTPSTPESGAPQRGPADARLARRVSGWTSNLLATGIVLVAAVGVGRQLVQWWRIEPESAIAPAVGPTAIGPSGEQPLELSFNGGYSLRRIEFEGDLAAATERLRSECRMILEKGRLPGGEPNAGERRFLDRTAGRSPLEEHAGKWQIHQFEGKLPLLVAVAQTQIPTVPSAAREESGLLNLRVVAWGLAMPTDEEAYTLLVYEAAGDAAEGHAPHEIPLPGFLRRTLTLRGQGGTSMGVSGDLSPARTRNELDQFLAARAFRSSGWRVIGGAWHNRYRSADTSNTIDVQLSDNNHGGVSGLLITNNQ